MSLADKVAFLQRPDSYPEAPRAVDSIETHLSWVFLTPDHAYKMKKPVRYGSLNFSSLAARRRNAEEEVRINRRLAPDVYLGTVALRVSPTQGLALLGRGRVVDWLVKMRRLPKTCLLDTVIAACGPERQELEAVARTLSRFYQSAAAIPITVRTYLSHYSDRISATNAELRAYPDDLPLEKVQHVYAAQQRFLVQQRALIAARVRDERIVEGHGDLRPEHVCLGDPPLIIDSLEFNRRLRIVDPVDELGFLAMECRQLGAPEIEAVLFDGYERLTHDRVPLALRRFYQSVRAAVRAKLMLWHLRDPVVADPEKWRVRARRYLDLADTLMNETR